MSVKIRMKKMGRKNRSYFRVCAMDVRSPRDGRVIEELGTYDPWVPETDARAILNGERIDYWLGVGAQASPKVSVLIRKYGKGGSHLDAQTQAIARLGQRRAKAIQAAVAAAAAVPPPAPPAPVETASAVSAAEGSENSGEGGSGDGASADGAAGEGASGQGAE